jgi:hypothetical protein
MRKLKEDLTWTEKFNNEIMSILAEVFSDKGFSGKIRTGTEKEDYEKGWDFVIELDNGEIIGIGSNVRKPGYYNPRCNDGLYHTDVCLRKRSKPEYQTEYEKAKTGLIKYKFCGWTKCEVCQRTHSCCKNDKIYYWVIVDFIKAKEKGLFEPDWQLQNASTPFYYENVQHFRENGCIVKESSKCPICNNTGFNERNMRVGWRYQMVKIPCPICNGESNGG